MKDSFCQCRRVVGQDRHVASCIAELGGHSRCAPKEGRTPPSHTRYSAGARNAASAIFGRVIGRGLGRTSIIAHASIFLNGTASRARTANPKSSKKTNSACFKEFRGGRWIAATAPERYSVCAPPGSWTSRGSWTSHCARFARFSVHAGSYRPFSIRRRHHGNERISIEPHLRTRLERR
jgi:hypothetical protein